ncbi:MAG: Gfo/Idh/MocA family oxidoreductase [Armatimonadetes bacterium]|nr:Gfo/Idh/MocA family oxidoreductase [Armatimonadota bacterium]
MKELKVGLIGAGGMGQHLAVQCDSLEEAQLVAAADPSEEALQRLASKVGESRIVQTAGADQTQVGAGTEVSSEDTAAAGSDVRRYADYNDLLASDVDGVIIAAPNNLHADIAVAAANKGKHIFCEKPMALGIAECDRMLEAAEKAGVTLMVGQVLRLIPVFWQSHKIATGGDIGKPFAINITRLSSWWFGPGWRSQKAKSGGVVYEVHVHELDFMRHVLGEAESVYASMGHFTAAGVDYEDTAFIQIRFRNGGIGSLHCGISSSVNQYGMTIQCTEGTLVNEGFGKRLQYARFGESHQVIEPEMITLEEPYRAELGSWAQHILHAEPMVFDASDGRAAIELAEAAYRSAQSGSAVPLPL